MLGIYVTYTKKKSKEEKRIPFPVCYAQQVFGMLIA